MKENHRQNISDHRDNSCSSIMPRPPLPNPCFEKFHTPPQGPGATVLGEDPRCKLAEKSKMYGWGPGGRKGSMDWYFCGPGPFFKAVHLLFMFLLFFFKPAFKNK